MLINFIYRLNGAFPWSMREGFINTLRRQGHTVRVFTAQFNSVNQKPHNKEMLEFLKQPADLILVMGGGDKYCGFYADDAIIDFMVNCKIPRVAYFMESMFSRKRTQSRYERSIKCWSHILTVDETDVPEIKKSGCQNVNYISGWVDEELFKPMNLVERFEFQFIGFPHVHRQPTIEYLKTQIGMVNHRYFTDLDYVGGINETRVLIGLPSVFKGFTQRVTETLSCGKLLLYPSLPDNLVESKRVFRDGEHILFYNNLDELVHLARYYSVHDKERKEIERNARQEILDKHTVGIRVKQFLKFAYEDKI